MFPPILIAGIPQSILKRHHEPPRSVAETNWTQGEADKFRDLLVVGGKSLAEANDIAERYTRLRPTQV